MASGNWPEETREMRLISKVIEGSRAVKDKSLPQFIARRRRPDSSSWRTWDQITIELHGVLDEVITDVSLRKWADRYGIPDQTLSTHSPVTPDEYDKALTAAGIDI